MATLFTLIGASDASTSAARLGQRMADATGGRRLRLDWFGTASLTWRCVAPTGQLATRIAPALHVAADMACIARLEKSATAQAAFTDLAQLFAQFGQTAALVRSDGTVLALRLAEEGTWLSDRPELEQDPGGWVTFAQAHFGDTAGLVSQSHIQNQLSGGPGHATSR